MKSIVCALVLLGIGSSLFGDCDSEYPLTNTLGSVKGKLACLADENKKLKEELANARSKTQLTRIFLNGSMLKTSTFQRDSCKNRAVDSVVKRGGRVIEQDSDAVELQLNDHAIMVQCGLLVGSRWTIYDIDKGEKADIDDFGFLIVTGPDPIQNSDISTLLKSEIFP